MNEQKLTDQELKNLEPVLLPLIKQESKSQIAKWGIQVRTPEEWMLYLMEEVGELAEAIAEHKYRNGETQNVVNEGIQVAALTLKIIENYLPYNPDIPTEDTTQQKIDKEYPLKAIKRKTKEIQKLKQNLEQEIKKVISPSLKISVTYKGQTIKQCQCGKTIEIGESSIKLSNKSSRITDLTFHNLECLKKYILFWESDYND